MNCLYICSESSKVYLFKMDSISVIELPSNFYTQSVVLSKDGRKVILKDLNNFILMNFGVGENYFTFEPRKYNNTYNNQREIEEDDENAQTNLARKGDEDQYYDDNNGHYDNYDENNNYNTNYEGNNFGEEGEMNPQGTFNNQNNNSNQ